MVENRTFTLMLASSRGILILTSFSVVSIISVVHRTFSEDAFLVLEDSLFSYFTGTLDDFSLFMDDFIFKEDSNSMLLLELVALLVLDNWDLKKV